MSGVINCMVGACEATIKDNKWAKIKSDWFIQNNGDAFCPEHLPSWVPEWRAKQKIARPNPETTHLAAVCCNCATEVMKPLGENQTWVHIESGDTKCPSTKEQPTQSESC